MGSKWAHSTCLCTPNNPKVSLEKHIFDPFLTDFWLQNNPFSRHFVTLKGPKGLAMGSKRAHFTSLCTPNGPGSFFGKTHFCPIFGCKTAHFQGILGFYEGQNGPPRAQNAPKTFVLAFHVVHVPILVLSGAFGGRFAEHVVELEGPRGPFSTGKSSCMCRVATISLDLAVFSGF